MPARDPNTGQFLSSDESGGSQWYDDYEIQTVRLENAIPASVATGATGEDGESWGASLLNNSEPAGGLARDEVAELVALESDLTVYTNSTSTADGTVKGRYQLSTRAEGTMIDSNDVNDETSPGNFTVQMWEDNTPSNIVVQEAVGHSPFSDTATGVGGAGTTGTDTFVVDYREAFGRGPTFDQHGDLAHTGEMTAWNVADAACHMDINLRMVWDIFEKEERLSK